MRNFLCFVLSYIISPIWKDGELPVLPLSVYGAVAMAHNEDSEEYSSPHQFFFYLYDKRNVSLILHFVCVYIASSSLLKLITSLLSDDATHVVVWLGRTIL